MDKIKIRIENLDRTVEVPVGQDLRSALLDEKIEIYEGIWSLLNCHGKGTCGTCQVEVIEGEGLNDPSFYERKRLELQGRGPDPSRLRLACLTRCYRDATVATLVAPAAALVE